MEFNYSLRSDKIYIISDFGFKFEMLGALVLHLNIVSSYSISSIKILLIRKKLDQQENYLRVYTTVFL